MIEEISYNVIRICKTLFINQRSCNSTTFHTIKNSLIQYVPSKNLILQGIHKRTEWNVAHTNLEHAVKRKSS